MSELLNDGQAGEAGKTGDAAAVAAAAASAAAGDKGAAGEAGKAAPAAGDAGGSDDWLGGIKDAEARDYITRIGAKDLESALRHGASVEKMLGVPKDRLMRWPERSRLEDPDAYKDIMEKLGLPTGDDAHTKYDLPEVDGVFKFADDTEKAALQKAFHDLGILPDQAKGVMEKLYAPMIKAQAEKSAAASASAASEAEAALKAEWGAKYDENLGLAQAGELALPEETSAWMVEKGLNNDPHMIRILQDIGAARVEAGEAPGRGDGSGPGKRTPDEMRASVADFEERHSAALNNAGHPDHDLRVKERMQIIKSGSPSG